MFNEFDGFNVSSVNTMLSCGNNLLSTDTLCFQSKDNAFGDGIYCN